MLAVLAATTASMVIGTVWYTPKVFGNAWMRLAGITPPADYKREMYKGILIGFVGSLIRAYVLAQFVYILASMDWMEALVVAFWIWLGFTATVLVNVVAWEGKSWKLFLIHGGYHFVTLAVMSVILTYFA